MIAVSVLIVLSLNVSALTVIDSMDEPTGWMGGKLETENIKEGTGAIRIDSPTLLQFNKKFAEPMDLSMYEEDGMISLWIYFENVDVFANRDNSMEFTSSGNCDVEESGFDLSNSLFENGWNHMLVGLDEFASYDADWSRINYIRFYKFTEGDNTMIVDNIRIGSAADFGVGKIPLRKSASLFESFDSAEGFDSQTVETSRNIEGAGAIVSGSDSLLSISKTYAAPVDMSRIAENGYAYLWIYIEDPSLLADGGAIEITSGGTYDAEETSWNIDDSFEFKAGWNEVLLDASQADFNECDFSRVNYIRVYMNTTGSNTMMLDKMYLGVGEDFGIQTEPPETEPPETEAPATEETAEETTPAPASAKSSGNMMLYVIIAAVVIVILVIVIAVIIKRGKKTE